MLVLNCAPDSTLPPWSPATSCSQIWSVQSSGDSYARFFRFLDVETTSTALPTLVSSTISTGASVADTTGPFTTWLTSALSIREDESACIPPRPTPECPPRWLASGCPTGWRALSTAIASGTATEFCCPDQPEMASITTYLEGKGGTRGYCYGYNTNVPSKTLSNNIFTFTWMYNTTKTSATLTHAQYVAAAITVLYPVKTGSQEFNSISTEGSSNSMISTNKKVGIGVGVGLGLLLLLVVVIFFIQRVYKSKAKTEDTQSPWGKPELDGDAVSKIKYATEINGENLHELDDADQAGELRGTNIQELEDTGIPVEIGGEVCDDTVLESQKAVLHTSSRATEVTQR